MRFLLLLSALLVSLTGVTAGAPAHAEPAVSERLVGATATLAIARTAVLRAPHRLLIEPVPASPSANVDAGEERALALVISGTDARRRE